MKKLHILPILMETFYIFSKHYKFFRIFQENLGKKSRKILGLYISKRYGGEAPQS